MQPFIYKFVHRNESTAFRLEVTCCDTLFSISFSARFVGACALKIETNSYISAITTEEVS